MVRKSSKTPTLHPPKRPAYQPQLVHCQDPKSQAPPWKCKHSRAYLEVPNRRDAQAAMRTPWVWTSRLRHQDCTGGGAQHRCTGAQVHRCKAPGRASPHLGAIPWWAPGTCHS